MKNTDTKEQMVVQDIPKYKYEEYSQPDFVERMLREGKDRGYCKLVLADAVVTAPMRAALLNIILWECLFKYNIHPKQDDMRDIDSVSAKHIARLQSRIYFRILVKLSTIDKIDFKVTSHMPIVKALADNICHLHSIACDYLPQYMPSMDVLGLARFCANPEVKKIIDEKIPNTIGTQAAEKIIKQNTNKILDLIARPHAVKDNILFLYQRADTLKKTQISNEIYKYGPRSDIDDRMFRHIVNESSLSGLKSPADFITESLGAKKCAHMTKNVLKTSQYMGRKVRLGTSHLKNLYNGECGSTRTLPFFIEPEFAPNMEYRSIVDNGELVQLTKKNISKYVNKTVNLLSVFCCNHTDGFCERCAGFRYFPQYGFGLHVFQPENIHVGVFSSTQVISIVTQKILSSKHQIATLTKIYNLPIETQKYFVTDGDSLIYWKKDTQKLLKKIALRIPNDSIGHISDLTLDTLPAPETFSKLTYVDLVDTEDDNRIIDTAFMKDSGFIPYLSKEMLEYIRQVYDEVTFFDNGYLIPMDRFNLKQPVMGFSIMNDDMVSYVNTFKSFIETEVGNYTSVGRCLHDFAQVVYHKSSLNLFYLEVLLRALNCTSKTDPRIPVLEDFDHTCFMGLDHKVTEDSITMKLSQEKIQIYLRDPNVFLTPRNIGLFGPLYGMI